MATIAPRGGAKTPGELGNNPLSKNNLTEDYARYCQDAHAILRGMGLELHAAGVLIRRRIKDSGSGVEKFQLAGQARKAARPMMRAADQANSAADGVLRAWRDFLHVITEIMAARGAKARGGRH